MTPPEFSVLLLAWDDADPRVAVLGGAALPPTLPLVYRLAAQQPVLAVYPHLPAEEATAPLAKNNGAGPAAPTAPAPRNAAEPGPSGTSRAPVGTPAAATPGVQVLPAPPASSYLQTAPAAPQLSRIVGLDDLVAASSLTSEPLASALPTATTRPPAPSARSQWPGGASLPGQPRVPAAPYAGTDDNAAPAPAAPGPAPGTEPGAHGLAGPAEAARPASALGADLSTQLPRAGQPPARDRNADPDPERPGLQVPEAFDEVIAEPGPAEALALLAPEDDLTPDAPAAPTPATAAPTPGAAPAPVVLTPALDGLNFRMIQYARRAAQLVRGRRDFGVIYAPNWPAWLAALEIRNSSGQPLVLYAAGLAADFSSPAERGWLLEVERMALRRAHLILVPTTGLRRRLQQQYGTTIGAVRVVAAADEEAVRRALREAATG